MGHSQLLHGVCHQHTTVVTLASQIIMASKDIPASTLDSTAMPITSDIRVLLGRRAILARID